MEAEMNKPGPNGTPGAGYASPGYGMAAPLSSNPAQMLGTILRALAVALTLVATIVMGVAKQTVYVDVYDVDGDLLGTVSAPAKSVYASAFVYFIAANAIVFAYSSVSMAVSIGRRAASGSSALLPVGDLMMVALLFSCNGATAAIALIAQKGNGKAGWGRFCNAYGKFCGHITLALVLSMIAAAAYVKLLILSVISLHKRTQ